MADKGQYETFDSAGGPTTKGQGETAHEDAGSALQDHGVEHGAIPEMPQKK